MRRLERYISAGGRLLRLGYTTGTCAAAAARAAAELLLNGVEVPEVEVDTPAGERVVVEVEESASGLGWARCAVRKDAGDDPDVTDGVLVYARVSVDDDSDAEKAVQGVPDGSEPGTEQDGVRVVVDGGVGVGRVTRAGLDQPVGSAAINSVPRAMIDAQVREVAHACGFVGTLEVEVSIPEGVELAARTFNPRLGIEGGISVLGTTGLVRPMSEDALVRSLQLELGVLAEEGVRDVLVVPGNYGRDFARDGLGLDVRQVVSCSNYLGATIDEAARLGMRSLLVVGHLGKMAKVAAGVMNTHSRVADCRLETLCAHAALAGATREVAEAVMDATTTDAALGVLDEAGLLEATMDSLVRRLGMHLARRAGERMRIEAVVFGGLADKRTVLGATEGAQELVETFRTQRG